jgi:hypothetical protein
LDGAEEWGEGGFTVFRRSVAPVEHEAVEVGPLLGEGQVGLAYGEDVVSGRFRPGGEVGKASAADRGEEGVSARIVLVRSAGGDAGPVGQLPQAD